MRSTFAGLNTMVRGITANQLSLDTTGHNITNAGTEGYSRQTVTLATTYSEHRGGLHGEVLVGTGVDAQAVERARDVYADIQYRNENPSQQYYEIMAKNYDKLETIFDDSRNLGIESALNKFYQTWVDLSTNASNSSARTQVIEQGRNLSDILQTATSELQEQIRSEYADLSSEIKQVDDILEEIVIFNKQISAQEIGGATANDLRDKRDLLVDQLSNYMNVSFSETERGYQINSGGVTLINGPTRAHLAMSDGVSSSVYGIDYGITDYNIKIKESDLVFMPQNGILKARLDSIAEDKKYIDKIADIASFMLTAFNEQHKQGWDMNGDSKLDSDGNTVPDTINFYGEGNTCYEYRYDAEYKRNYLYKDDADKKTLSGVQIISELEVNSKFSENRGDRYIAAATSKQYVETTDSNGNIVGTWEEMEWGERTGDGTNAVYLSELFNISQETIISDNKANALVSKNLVLRDLDGNKILDDKGNEQPATALTTLSLNSFYQESMSTLGINAYSTDTNYEGMQAVMMQINNWRDSMSGVDWNEELTNMIRFQKGFASCSRCLNAMDEMLERLVTSTGVVGR